MRDATADGLPDARDTAHDLAQQLGQTPADAGHLVALDIRITSAFLAWARQLALGIHEPDRSARRIDVTEVLAGVKDRASAQVAIERLEPAHADYRHLRDALRHYRSLTERGGWPTIPDVLLKRREADGALPIPNAETQALILLCKRLAVTGDLDRASQATCAGPASALIYGRHLEAAVRRFQARHGLIADGIVGPRTLAELNVPVETRVAQLVSNMERWRRIADDLGGTHVVVNIAGFWLRALEDGREVLSMRVITGKPATATPVMSDEIDYLVFRPYWNVPASITQRELLPRIVSDPDYLRRQRFEVVDGWQQPATTVDPSSLDWARMTDFPYRLRQRPGPGNSLGLVKFMFPNAHHVYLHDTPSKHLFEAPRRAFSHGCVRVQDPIALAEFLLRNEPAWPLARIESAMTGGRRRTVLLQRPVPIHLTYFTAWEDNGTVNFRADIYGLDHDDA